jgi:hypothetical protein
VWSRSRDHPTGPARARLTARRRRARGNGRLPGGNRWGCGISSASRRRSCGVFPAPWQQVRRGHDERNESKTAVACLQDRLGILLFFSIGNVLGHITLSLIESGPPTVFIAWAGFNFLAAGILLIPYRRGEKWAWFIIWVLVIPYALVILFNQEIGPIYLGEAR